MGRAQPTRNSNTQPQNRNSRSRPDAALGDLAFSPSVLDAEHLTSSMQRIAAGQRRPDSQWLDMFFAVTSGSLDTFTAEQLARLIQAMAMIELDISDSWAQLFLRATWERMPEADTIELACWLRSLAVLQIRPDKDWMAGYVQQVIQDVKSMESIAAAEIMWAIAKFGYRPADVWLYAVAARVYREGCLTLPSASLGRLAWALASFDFAPQDDWFQEFASDVTSRPDLTVADVAAIVWSLAVFQTLPDADWLQQCYSQSCGQLADLPAADLVNIIWAVAALEMSRPDVVAASSSSYQPSRRWLDEWLLAVQPLIGGLDKTSLLKVLWAVAMLDIKPVQSWLHSLVTMVDQQLQANAFDVMELLYLTRCVNALVDARGWTTAAEAAAAASRGHHQPMELAESSPFLQFPAPIGGRSSTSTPEASVSAGPTRSKAGGTLAVSNEDAAGTLDYYYYDDDDDFDEPGADDGVASDTGPVQGAGHSRTAPTAEADGAVSAAEAGDVAEGTPSWLSGVLKAALGALSGRELPPHWRRLNVRFPPYALPAEELERRQWRHA